MICQTRRPYSSLYYLQMTELCRLRLLKKTLCNLHELNNVNNWLTSNRICINADKTKYMIFSYRNYYILLILKVDLQLQRKLIILKSWESFLINISHSNIMYRSEGQKNVEICRHIIQIIQISATRNNKNNIFLSHQSIFTIKN